MFIVHSETFIFGRLLRFHRDICVKVCPNIVDWPSTDDEENLCCQGSVDVSVDIDRLCVDTPSAWWWTSGGLLNFTSGSTEGTVTAMTLSS
jgi:hypothetical protein